MSERYSLARFPMIHFLLYNPDVVLAVSFPSPQRLEAILSVYVGFMLLVLLSSSNCNSVEMEYLPGPETRVVLTSTNSSGRYMFG